MDIDKLLEQVATDPHFVAARKANLLGTSEFQTLSFIRDQHATPERQWLQLSLHLESYYDSIRLQKVDLAVARLDLDALLAKDGGDEAAIARRALKADKMRLGIEGREQRLRGSARQLEITRRAMDGMEPLTLDQIEAAEPGYWRDRLIENALLGVVNRFTGMGLGELRALVMCGAITRDQLREFASKALTGLPIVPQLTGPQDYGEAYTPPSLVGAVSLADGDDG